MNQILAIARIAVRNAVRSRVVISLAAILALVTIGLPMTIKGDGTAEGFVRILLSYTLGFAGLILALSSMWAGCATVAAEIDGKQIQMVASKPVHGFHIWLGKWLGLMCVNSLMLVFCGLVTYGLLVRQVSRLPEADAKQLREKVLVSRQVIPPRPIDIDSPARALLRTKMDNHEVPAGMAPDDALEAIRRGLLGQAYTVAPGSTCAWVFDLPRDHADVTLKFRADASQIEALNVKGTWIAGDLRREVQFSPGTWQEITIPNPGGRTLEIQYSNSDERGYTVIFSPDDGLTAMVPAGGFEGNFVRALLLIFAQLAFVTALGVTAGSLFSLPVAAFVSLYAVVLLQTGDYVSQASRQEHLVPWGATHGGASEAANEALRAFFKALSFALQPLNSGDPLDALSSGQLVSWSWVGHDLLLKMILYGGAMAVVGIYFFNRRELALPS